MYTKFTLTNATLIFIAVIISLLFVTSKIYYWYAVDFFALPFYFIPDSSELINSYGLVAISYGLVAIVDVLKANLLETVIAAYDYDISIIFIAVFLITFFICVCYALVRRKNKIAYVPLVCSILGV